MSNHSFKISVAIILLINIFSCRKEEMERIEAAPNETLLANSKISKLMQEVSLNDGSSDNILDKSNCFNIKLPIEVNVNNNKIVLNSKEDYNKVEYIFDDDDDDNDHIAFNYPYTIILSDFSEAIINSDVELDNFSNQCNGENIEDEDIECLDFKYPITGSAFNKNNELLRTFSITTDYSLFQFIENLTSDEIITIDFPIRMTLYDNTMLEINNLYELESTINLYKNDCDEDDDYDYNDDDCNDCNIEQLTNVLTKCDGWVVDKLKRYYNNYDNYYDGYTFNFSPNGSINVSYYSNTYNGTWKASGGGDNLKVIINIPELPYCNNNWILQEISEYTETKINFIVGNDDRIRYKNVCN